MLNEFFHRHDAIFLIAILSITNLITRSPAPFMLVPARARIKLVYPAIPHYVVSEAHVKVPAGWLIEQAGFKGKRFGDAGIHKNQALVLVNYGNATGQEILNVSKDIQKTILEKYGIVIEAEVNVI
jgi:UDP-N-acetylmuramate dehydrogenase